MAKPKQKKPKPDEVELEPDAWERFEKAVGKMVPKRKAPEKKNESVADD